MTCIKTYVVSLSVVLGGGESWVAKIRDSRAIWKPGGYSNIDAGMSDLITSQQHKTETLLFGGKYIILNFFTINQKYVQLACRTITTVGHKGYDFSLLNCQTPYVCVTR